MTDILKVVDILPDEASRLAKKLHIKKDEIRIYRKALVGDVEDAAGEERTIVARVSTNDRDRDGEIVEPKGIDLKDFQANPVLCWAHDYKIPPVGKALWSKTDDNGLVCKFQFAQTQFAEDVYQLYKGGYLRAFSIGFIATDYDAKTKTYNKISLLEVSCVPVPANQGALVMDAFTKGIVTSEALKKDLGLNEPAPVEEPAEAKAEEAAEAPATDAPVAEEPEAEAKTFDLKGNPSVNDIYSALYRAIDPEADTRPFDQPPAIIRYVADLFPVAYPDGWFVCAECEANQATRYLLYKYRYADGVAALADNPTEVAPGYVRKEWAEKIPSGSVSVADLHVTLSPEASLAALLKINEQCVAIQKQLAEMKLTNGSVLPPKQEIIGPPAPFPAPVPASIRITSSAPVEKSAVEQVLDVLRSGELDERVRIIVERAIGRVR